MHLYLHFTGTSCTDTAGFDNGGGFDCATYVSQGWCADGAAVAGQEWTLGASFNYPENNCCACGKTGDDAAVTAGMINDQLMNTAS